MPLRKNSGFTLVELLVVITIIGILIALLLPAVQAAREAARRLQCANNFKQVGLAMHNYHASMKMFPPGVVMYADWYVPWDFCGMVGTSGYYHGAGWGAFILPYLEQQQVYDQFDFSLRSCNVDPNFAAGRALIPAYLCPSDPQGDELVSNTGSTDGKPPDLLEEEDYRRTSMAGVTDSMDWTCNTVTARQFSKADGMMAQLQGCRIRDVVDGTSNTLMVGEVTGGGRGSYNSHFWVSQTLSDTYDGINGISTIPGGSPSWAGNSYAWRDASFSSFHPGGCHFLMADGSVQFLSENIASISLSALATRGGGEPISESF